MSLDRAHPVDRAVIASSIIPRDGVVLVAVSGGADSMALVEALRNTTPSIAVAHFDHRLRDDSARDAEHVAEYAREHGLEFVLGSGDVARRARSERSSIEVAARDARYEFLSDAARNLDARCVATAHTRSDQVETILMRILRGTGRVGVCGIPARRGPFDRPLLDVTGNQTRDYCRARNVAFRDDPTNRDLRFVRNRVRLEILPKLRASFPNIDEALLRLAESARREQRAFALRTEGWLNEHVREESPGVWTIRPSALDSFEDDDALSLLRESLARAGLAHDVDRTHYARLLELARCGHAGSSADLPGFSARREHDAMVLMRGDQPCREFSKELSIPGRTQVGDWTIDASFITPGEARRGLAAHGACDAYFDAAALSLPLVVRSIRPGDSMHPFGLGGRKKLSDLLIDRKVPRRHRERLVVIEGESIYWVPGVATSELGRIGDRTASVVRIEARAAGGAL